MHSIVAHNAPSKIHKKKSFGKAVTGGTGMIKEIAQAYAQQRNLFF